MIGPHERREALLAYGADMDRAAYRLAVGLSGGQTTGGYHAFLKDQLLTSLTDAVTHDELLTREEWEQAVAEDEAFDQAEASGYARERAGEPS